MEGLILDDIEDEEDQWGNQISGRNCVVFLVDYQKDMFVQRKENSYFKQSIICCRDAMLDIARKQRSHLVGVVLYGTQITEGKYAPDNVSVLQELTVPSVEVIKRFNELLEDDFKELQDKFGNHKEADLTRAVNYCQILIHLCKKKLYLRNIVMMTSCDNPCGNDVVAAFRARKQANELYQHQIEFDVVSFGQQFDSSKLFKELILTSKGELLKDWEEKDVIMKIEDVHNQIEKLTQKIARRISFLRIGSEENEKLILQISLYKLFAEPRKFLTTVKQPEKSVNGSENKESSPQNKEKSQRKDIIVDDDDDDAFFAEEKVMEKITEIEKSAINKTKEFTSNDEQKPQVDHFQAQLASEENHESLEVDNELYPDIGGKLFNITKSELKKRTGSSAFNIKRGFQLIGFVQTADVPFHFSLGEPYFVVSYGRDKNNRIAFSHFLHKCMERGVSMIGWFCLTRSASPSLTCLHPLKMTRAGKGHPDGFLLVKMPFSDDLFEVDDKESAITKQPTEEQLNAARKIVSKLTLPYKVDMFNDAEFNVRTAMIEALAMEYEDIPTTEDNTDIDLDDVGSILGDLNSLFIGQEDLEDEYNTTSKAKKRPAASDGTFRGGKQRKQSEAIEMIQNGQANKLTVAELRDILKSEGIMSISTFTKPRLVSVATKRFCTDSK